VVKVPKSRTDEYGEYYALTYDQSVAYWREELEFYQSLVDWVSAQGHAVLELACGTGRITLGLIGRGAHVVGLDISRAMLEVARTKSQGVDDIEWVEGDMRDFQLGRQFGLIMIPAHSFQNLLTPADQVACLECIKRHLVPNGVLVIHLDHQDVDWLGELMGEKGGVFEPAEDFEYPETERRVQASRAWWYRRSDQTAIVQTIWEEMDDSGAVVDRIDSGQIEIHCVFFFEMQHLLARVGFAEPKVYADFFRNPFQDDSDQMIWIVGDPMAVDKRSSDR
jgi:ubiquinone/menaquinone biosynthesis C-methylase UbiE